MTSIDGVTYVGMISGSSSASGSASSMMMSSGGTHNLNVFVLLDEDTAKDNGPVAKQLEKNLQRAEVQGLQCFDFEYGPVFLYGKRSDREYLWKRYRQVAGDQQ